MEKHNIEITSNRAVIRLAFLLCVALAPSALSQSYSPLYTPGSIVGKYVVCTDGPGGPILPSCNMTVTTANYPGTNGHTSVYHTSPAPSSGLSLSYGSGPYSQTLHFNTAIGVGGSVLVSLKAGMRWSQDSSYDARLVAGQAETFRACPDGQPSSNCAVFDYAVGWNDLYWVEQKPQWLEIGATVQHENSVSYNHWLTSTAANGFWYATQAFMAAHPEQGQIGINDMALSFGGIFDLSGNWQPPHWEHGRGTAADVRGNGGPASIPNDQQDEFITYCVQNGAYYGQVEFTGTPNQHIHCQWPTP